MELLGIAIEELVSAGIKSYIDLLGHGERTRSRQLFSDALQLSALMAGGPSARISPLLIAERSTWTNARSMRSCLILLTLRSILATLLVLKASAYWRRVPALEELQTNCVKVAEYLGGPPALEPRLNCGEIHETDTACGGRRNDALPSIPELPERSVPAM